MKTKDDQNKSSVSLIRENTKNPSLKTLDIAGKERRLVRENRTSGTEDAPLVVKSKFHVTQHERQRTMAKAARHLHPQQQ